MSQLEYLREQVAVAIQIADEAKLPNVRDRHLQSAAAWILLAERAQRLEEIQRSGIIADW
jgi:hypothetical protein